MGGVLAFVETSLSGSGCTAMEYASALGGQVLFLTRDPGYYARRGARDPCGLGAVSEVIPCETNDPHAVAGVLAARGVTAVLSAGEYHVVHAAAAAHELGAYGLAPRAAQAARNKRRCYEICAASGIAVPAHGIAGTAADAVAIGGRIGYPCVVKPVDGTASGGVRYCATGDDVAAAAQVILSTVRNPRGQPCAGEVMVAAYHSGPEVSVETLSHNGVTVVYGVTDKHVTPLPYFVETGHTFPSAWPLAQTAQCVQMARAALAAIGHDNGMAHTELLLTRTGPMLLEINARPAGDHITDLVRLATGTDPLKEWMRAVLDQGLAAAPDVRGAAAIVYLTPSPGGVVRATGEGEARRSPGVVSVSLRLGEGDVTIVPRSSHDRSGYVIATGDRPVLAERHAETAVRQLLVVSEEPDDG